jgi:uncharacterized protein YcbX
MTPRIDSMFRYPVKGLSPERLTRAELSPGAHFPGDRLFAIENGPSGFDPEAPEHQPKIKYLMLMRNERLARLSTRFDEGTGELAVSEGGREVVRGNLRARDGRLALEAFLRRFMPAELRGPPKVLSAPDGYRFTDSRTGHVSIVNLASVAAIEDIVGRPVDPLRFRANLYVSGLEPWAEFERIGQVLEASSGARLRVTRRIKRCAATNVDPVTAVRDLEIPDTLLRRLGHADCGVYAEVTAPGAVAAGDRLSFA